MKLQDTLPNRLWYVCLADGDVTVEEADEPSLENYDSVYKAVKAKNSLLQGKAPGFTDPYDQELHKVDRATSPVDYIARYKNLEKMWNDNPDVTPNQPSSNYAAVLNAWLPTTPQDVSDSCWGKEKKVPAPEWKPEPRGTSGFEFL